MFTDHRIEAAEHELWFKAALDDPFTWYLILERLGSPIALVNFSLTNVSKSYCRWGFYLVSDSFEKGTGSVMAWLSLDWCLQFMGIKKVFCQSFAFNHKACRLYEKFGFSREPNILASVNKNGVLWEVLEFSLDCHVWARESEKLAKSIFVEF